MSNDAKSATKAYPSWYRIFATLASAVVSLSALLTVVAVVIADMTTSIYLSEHHAQWLEPNPLSLPWLPASAEYAFAVVTMVLIFPIIFQAIIQIPVAKTQPVWLEYSSIQNIFMESILLVLAIVVLFFINGSSKWTLLPLAIIAICSAALLDVACSKCAMSKSREHRGHHGDHEAPCVNEKDSPALAADISNIPHIFGWVKLIATASRVLGVLFAISFTVLLWPHSELVRANESTSVTKISAIAILIAVVEFGVCVSTISWWLIDSMLSSRERWDAHNKSMVIAAMAAFFGLIWFFVVGASLFFSLPLYVVRELGFGGRVYVYSLKKKDPILSSMPSVKIGTKIHQLNTPYNYELCQIWRSRRSFFVTTTTAACRDRSAYQSTTIIVLPVKNVMAISGMPPVKPKKSQPKP